VKEGLNLLIDFQWFVTDTYQISKTLEV